MSNWTDELKKTVIDAYEAMKPTSETTTEIIKELAETHEKTVNGVRMILTKAGVYVSKTPATSSSTPGDKTKKKTKQESLDDLSALIAKTGSVPDATIVDKMTGKAAEYFIAVINNVIGTDEAE
jgi:hypothetical protein